MPFGSVLVINNDVDSKQVSWPRQYLQPRWLFPTKAASYDKKIGIIKCMSNCSMQRVMWVYAGGLV
ncbi:MAG: hypothetical protein C7B47_10815 [Sulfobacillus thermosulfidooxidans]|uniref:Uncharacterized protein n=1 Tax=Sulfobacillus thermosulfidooxidans TaxID=28034 RepID=A0A2T2WVW1_SULTH|nr:MAG: hypothetical protein C7B47_10815 [Sulfobacillus thermosulfidooxidans]